MPTVSQAANNSAPKYHSSVCFLGPLLAPSGPGWVLKEEDSETEIKMYEVYQNVLLGSEGAGKKQDWLEGEDEL